MEYKLKRLNIPLVGGGDTILYIPYPLSEENYSLMLKWMEIMRLSLTRDETGDDSQDIGPCGSIIIIDN